MCTINQDHMMYGSWDIKCKGQSFLSFEPPNNQKNQNFEKIKMPGEIIILHLCTTNDNHMMNGSWDTDRIFRHFGLFLPFYPTNNPEKKKLLEIYYFTKVYHKWQPYDTWFRRHEVQQTEFFCHLGPFFALLPC